jgi:uncharacterized membrane protein YgcG
VVIGMRALTSAQADDIRDTLRKAERRTGHRFAVYVGAAIGPRRHFAERLHAALGAEAADAVLIFVDPAGHGLEIVTGERLRHRLTDGACRAAAMTMASSFRAGELADGLIQGINRLSDEPARR